MMWVTSAPMSPLVRITAPPPRYLNSFIIFFSVWPLRRASPHLPLVPPQESHLLRFLPANLQPIGVRPVRDVQAGFSGLHGSLPFEQRDQQITCTKGPIYPPPSGEGIHQYDEEDQAEGRTLVYTYCDTETVGSPPGCLYLGHDPSWLLTSNNWMSPGALLGSKLEFEPGSGPCCGDRSSTCKLFWGPCRRLLRIRLRHSVMWDSVTSVCFLEKQSVRLTLSCSRTLSPLTCRSKRRRTPPAPPPTSRRDFVTRHQKAAHLRLLLLNITESTSLGQDRTCVCRYNGWDVSNCVAEAAWLCVGLGVEGRLIDGGVRVRVRWRDRDRRWNEYCSIFIYKLRWLISRQPKTNNMECLDWRTPLRISLNFISNYWLKELRRRIHSFY